MDDAWTLRARRQHAARRRIAAATSAAAAATLVAAQEPESGANHQPPHHRHPQEINEADGVAAVHEAFRLGVNFFDTSPFYGATRSEAVLGRALKDLPRGEIVVSTKVRDADEDGTEHEEERGWE